MVSQFRTVKKVTMKKKQLFLDVVNLHKNYREVSIWLTFVFRHSTLKLIDLMDPPQPDFLRRDKLFSCSIHQFFKWSNITQRNFQVSTKNKQFQDEKCLNIVSTRVCCRKNYTKLVSPVFMIKQFLNIFISTTGFILSTLLENWCSRKLKKLQSYQILFSYGQITKKHVGIVFSMFL